MGNFLSYRLLPMVLNMSVTAGAAILFVLLARLLLKKAPKIFSYALWAVVLFRLLCPVSVATGFSLLGLLDAPVTEATAHTSVVEYVPRDVVHTRDPEVRLPVPGVNQSVNEALPRGQEQMAADPLEAPVVLATLAWMAGMGALAVYSAASLLRLRRRLVGAVPLRENLWLADGIGSPFVLGLLRPKIYLPSSLTEQEQSYIILHEQHHIRRGDHIVKALAFLALCVHWFNPLVWAAFVLSSRDMEMSCDEAVVKKLGESIRADYSASLLSLATGRRIIAGTPLAFGEGDTKGRIKNLLSWKKPRVWITVTAAAVCVAVAAACAGNPREAPAEPPVDAASMTGQFASMEEYARRVMDGKKTVHYYRPDGTEATANVTGTKLAWLEKQGEVAGLAPEGTLEAWTFHYLVQVDADPEQIMLVGGMYEEDGWYDLEGQGGHNIVALRHPDGTYNLVYNAVVNDNLDFYGCHNSYEEAVYDWYVTENGLDLPLYVKNLTVGGEAAPAHRYDGDGWYIYIPVSGWRQARVTGDNEECTWAWSSAYDTGAYLIVAYFGPEVAPSLRGNSSYLKPLDSENRVWEQQGDDYARRYFTDTPDGGCWRVSVLLPSGSTKDPGELETLYAMAESFTVDGRIAGGQTYVDEQSVPVYENGEITITVPAKFADLIKVDYFGSDNMFSVKANLYYAPEYIEHDLYTPSLNGGWMLTVSTTFPDFATSIVGQPSEGLLCGCWTEDGRLVYMENRPVEGFYNCEESNLEKFKEVLESIRIDYGNLTPFTEKSVADTTSTSAVPLTQEEINWFNDWFEPIVQDKQGNDIGVNPRCCFFTSYYDDVTELNFEEFMRYFPGDGSRTSDAEFEALRQVDGWPFADVASLEKMPVPVHKFPRRLVDLVLGEYAGISTADLDTGGVAYLPEYDAYYTYTSDFGPGIFVCARGEQDGEIIRLYSVNGTDLLTLRRVNDTSYQIVSLQRLESSSG
ncbi:M56 family metallopeptidase [Dysosmobacter sp.]|uniref:M56 family metallopeptidase n=1 Tax=Dysosmobacter sp. TaxID=2591382 RepID=UPI002A8E0B01|nr:M56 family metallopeptidase [Dysosmobacter sp.]MDY3282727.1 M56 family metallopeptidase [Dysosmobacter sp.]